MTVFAPASSAIVVGSEVIVRAGESSSLTVTVVVVLATPAAEAVMITDALPSSFVLFTGVPATVTDV